MVFDMQESKLEIIKVVSLVNKAVWRTSISPDAKWQWSGLKIQGSNWRPSIVTLTSSLHCWVMGSAHHLTKVNIWPKFNKYLSKVQEIWSEHEIQGSNSWPLTVTLTLSRHSRVMGSAHHLTKVNIWLKFQGFASKFKAQTGGLQLWPWLSQHSWDGFCISSHWGKHLTKV